ncbi:MAG: vWA domain-containing protein [Anaerovoracaceae bacterium]|nr:vWA domain-containing protein [Anaerovoracaceae bacterium]
MKKQKKFISLLLCLALTFTMVTVGMTAYAQDETGKSDTESGSAGNSSSGMKIQKTAVANGDGTYTIELEAYATGSKVITEITEEIPTDIVLVLDQSGSMKNPIGAVSFDAYSNNESTNARHYERRHNGGSASLWYKLEDSSYASVSVEKQEFSSYAERSTELVNYETNWRGNLTSDCYWYYSNNLYEKVGLDDYKKVALTREWVSRGGWFNGYYRYTYTFSNGDSITSDDDDTVPDLGSHAPLYTVEVDDTKTVYTYSYTNENGETQIIGTSIGANTQFGETLYQRSLNADGGGSRLNALKNAVTTFANSVATKAAGPDGDISTTEDNVDHRIAVVGFASGTIYGNTNYDYENTEVFIGSEQYKYGTEAQRVYSTALQSMSTSQGKANVAASVSALDANGGTLIDLGMEMANGILDANQVPDGEKRNRVIVVFTDGQPGWSGYDSDVADSTIAEGTKAKGNGVTVYTVGVFPGADATTTGDDNGDDTEKANWFMQNLSSNNGKVQNPSYYLSAGDEKTLNNIFRQISDQIETGGASTTLNQAAVIRDIISPYFTLPEGTDASAISLETWHCTGKDASGYTWSANPDAMGAAAAINGDEVSVTGFDFSANYVGTETAADGTVTYRGDKLVISFTVIPKPGFLGGNNVDTNTSAGVYENSSATVPVLEFNRPQVNVPVKDVAVMAQDKNVYLLGSLTAAQRKEGTAVQVGEDVFLNLTGENYGLETWQNAFVDISVKYYGTDGTTEIGDQTDLQEDQTYTVAVTVSPKEDAKPTSGGKAAAAKNGRDTAEICVYKPELTFRDSEVYYGDTVPDDYTANLTDTSWKHGETLYSAVTMIGDMPRLDLEYTPDSTKVQDGKIHTKQDIPVDAVVKIGETDVSEHTALIHTDCEDMTCHVPAGSAFLLHVRTCQLTVIKIDGAADEPYVFDVYKDGVKYSEITITGSDSQTIYELPVGKYTITEDDDWSWRFRPVYGDAAVLDPENPTGEITCTNTLSLQYWLNGFSHVLQNVFRGAAH